MTTRGDIEDAADRLDHDLALIFGLLAGWAIATTFARALLTVAARAGPAITARPAPGALGAMLGAVTSGFGGGGSGRSRLACLRVALEDLLDQLLAAQHAEALDPEVGGKLMQIGEVAPRKRC